MHFYVFCRALIPFYACVVLPCLVFVLSLCFISCGRSFPENKFNHERVGKNFFLAWWIDFYMEGTLEEDFEEHHSSEHRYTQQWV
jgi:hypothetical protein